MNLKVAQETGISKLGLLDRIPLFEVPNALYPIRISSPLFESNFLFYFQQDIKRFLDILLASFGVLILMPLLAIIAITIKLTSEGPIFYKSLRIGKNNKPFHMLKFRTMDVTADSLRETLREKANLEGELFKLEHDPRITPLGQFLRSYSLDELPQLLNVLSGEMSLVGPRPLPPDESSYFKSPYTLRFKLTPGITGLWQISGRSTLSFQQLCELELSYALKWNLLTDMVILFKTIPAVLLRKGAC